MTSGAIPAAELRDRLVAVADAMVASADLLTEADRMGDADHGAAMSRGFAAAHAALGEALPSATVGRLLCVVGTALLTKAGGASGAVFGTLFRSMGKAIGDTDVLTTGALADALAAGLADVTRRGGAKPGDKTMVDALQPAVEAVEGCRADGTPVAGALVIAADAAEQGKEATREMVARTGKAKTLGERTLGHVDPGALSLSILLRTLAAQSEC